MNAWMTFWGALLLVTLIFYAGLVVYVSIGGFKDIHGMFKSLSERGEDSADGDTDR